MEHQIEPKNNVESNSEEEKQLSWKDLVINWTRVYNLTYDFVYRA